MEITKDFSLKKYNTFGIDVKAWRFIKLDNEEEIPSLNEILKKKYFILGGGSNVLFTDDYEGIIIHPDFKGISIEEEIKDHFYINAGAGENWDDFVEYCTTKGYYGLENLSLIPGNVGASPVQNIGAYGVEVKDFIYQVKAYELATGECKYFNNKDCRFAYRDSIFKRELKNKYIITSVQFKLLKKPDLKLDFGNILNELKGVTQITPKLVRETVIKIREAKLPDPDEIGNAGSFFKNPIINKSVAENIESQYADVPIYKMEDGSFKIAAGWLIDKAGWKGRVKGSAGTHENQALVLINAGNASGKEILDFSEGIQKSVYKMCGIKLEPEVNIL